jgi:hypothetical protein
MIADYEHQIRKNVTRWCKTVSEEVPETPNHIARSNIARNIILNNFPTVSSGHFNDIYLPNIIGMVKVFAGEDADPAELTTKTEAILNMYVLLGVLQT